MTLRIAFSSVLLLVGGSCVSGARWHANEGLAAEKVEVQLDERGDAVEIEYHVRPETVPRTVRDAMERLHPGGTVVGAEKEFHGSSLYWELVKELDGSEVAAMFLPDGTLHRAEAEVDAASVPRAVRDAARWRLAAAPDTWEIARDGEGEIISYQANAESDGKRYKVLVDPDGGVLAHLREMDAEVEVPVAE